MVVTLHVGEHELHAEFTHLPRKGDTLTVLLPVEGQVADTFPNAVEHVKARVLDVDFHIDGRAVPADDFGCVIWTERV